MKRITATGQLTNLGTYEHRRGEQHSYFTLRIDAEMPGVKGARVEYDCCWDRPPTGADIEAIVDELIGGDEIKIILEPRPAGVIYPLEDGVEPLPVGLEAAAARSDIDELRRLLPERTVACWAGVPITELPREDLETILLYAAHHGKLGFKLGTEGGTG